jgi:hypothetical protein
MIKEPIISLRLLQKKAPIHRGSLKKAAGTVLLDAQGKSLLILSVHFEGI